MNAYLTLIKNFFKLSFSKAGNWILVFAAPVFGFLALFFLIKMSAGSAEEGFQAVGVILFFIMLQGALISGLTIKDRHSGVLSRILAAPVRYRVYSISNGIACFIILAAEILFNVLIISLIFPSLAGIFWKAAPLFLVFGLTSTGIGFFLAGISQTSAQSDIIVNFSVILSSIMAGVFFPAEFMSPLMQKISYIFPQRWAMQGIKELQTGKNYGDIWINLLILALIAVLAISMHGAVRRKQRY